jgi:hypothetical protein
LNWRSYCDFLFRVNKRVMSERAHLRLAKALAGHVLLKFG